MNRPVSRSAPRRRPSALRRLATDVHDLFLLLAFGLLLVACGWVKVDHWGRLQHGRPPRRPRRLWSPRLWARR